MTSIEFCLCEDDISGHEEDEEVDCPEKLNLLGDEVEGRKGGGRAPRRRRAKRTRRDREGGRRTIF